jgi:hypothetical protein
VVSAAVTVAYFDIAVDKKHDYSFDNCYKMDMA